VHPKILERMFVKRNLWSSGVYTTQWLINGKRTMLVVDGMIPAGDDNTFFTHPSPTGEFWPVILAKTWAKIFGTYKAVEFGNPMDPISAMTRAPDRNFKVRDTDPDTLWKHMVYASNQKYPGAASTTGANPKKYGLAEKHVYAFLAVYLSPQHGKVVKLYNPWGKDFYKGAVPNSDAINKPGVFTMLFSEFREAYASFSYSQIIEDYDVISADVPTNKKVVVDVTVPAGKFWVSLVWPQGRLLRPCDALRAWGYMKEAGGQALGTLRYSSNSWAYEVDNWGGGKATIEALIKITNAAWVQKVSLSVYAPVGATFKWKYFN